MPTPITNFDDFVEIYFESGTARLRLEEGLTLETLLDARLEKRKLPILKMHAYNKSRD